jgi:exodeoxyribonuclease VII small subunit
MATKPALPAEPALAPSAPEEPTYEAALAELERLVSSMESGQMPLDSLLGNYERASSLLALCRERLRAVENQVKVLEDGQLKDDGGAP